MCSCSMASALPQEKSKGPHPKPSVPWNLRLGQGGHLVRFADKQAWQARKSHKIWVTINHGYSPLITINHQ